VLSTFYLRTCGGGRTRRPAFPAPSLIQGERFRHNSSALRCDHSLVMPGLDPGIHQSSQEFLKRMDCRVKPGNDELKICFTWLFEIRIRFLLPSLRAR
jgi:hypothetical protein